MNFCFDKNIRLLVVGDLMLDHYIYGNCSRISPEAPVPVVEVKNEEYTLGGAGNVLKNLCAFKCSVDIVSVLGSDDNADIILNELASNGVSIDGIITDKSRCTTIKSRVLAANHQLIRLDKESIVPLSIDIEDLVIDKVKKLVPLCNVVLLSDYNKGLLTNRVLREIFNICHAARVKTIVDPKGVDFSKYRGVNVIKPNKREAIIATNIAIDNSWTLKNACASIAQTTCCDGVIVTMSEEGMAFFGGDELNIIPTKAIDVIDVTGAGDTVLAALGITIASGLSLEAACVFANHAAAVVVSKVGSAVATMDEINEKFSDLI